MYIRNYDVVLKRIHGSNYCTHTCGLDIIQLCMHRQIQGQLYTTTNFCDNLVISMLNNTRNDITKK